MIAPAQPPNAKAPWMDAIEAQIDVTRLVTNLLALSNNELHSQWQVDKALLSGAAPFAWNDETVDATLAASGSVPADALFNEWNLPARSVWWHFSKPLPVMTLCYDVSGRVGDEAFRQAGIRALSFGWIYQQPESITFPAGTPTATIDALLSGKLDVTERLVGVSSWVDDPLREHRMTPSQKWTWHEGETLGAMLARLRVEHQKVYGPGGRWARKPQVGVETFMNATEKVSRFILAGMTWLGQKVLVESAGHVERHRRKEFARVTGQNVDAVKVISLRRVERQHDHAEGDAGEPDADRWSCRWTVDGHFRNQACGPKQMDRRLTWIGPFVKGPADKPLRVSQQKVYVVNR